MVVRKTGGRGGGTTPAGVLGEGGRGEAGEREKTGGGKLSSPPPPLGYSSRQQGQEGTEGVGCPERRRQAGGRMGGSRARARAHAGARACRLTCPQTLACAFAQRRPSPPFDRPAQSSSRTHASQTSGPLRVRVRRGRGRACVPAAEGGRTCGTQTPLRSPASVPSNACAPPPHPTHTPPLLTRQRALKRLVDALLGLGHHRGRVLCNLGGHLRAWGGRGGRGPEGGRVRGADGDGGDHAHARNPPTSTHPLSHPPTHPFPPAHSHPPISAHPPTHPLSSTHLHGLLQQLILGDHPRDQPDLRGLGGWDARPCQHLRGGVWGGGVRVCVLCVRDCVLCCALGWPSPSNDAQR